uniref:Uncharacterized protein n=2 Tax=Timema TaxID=61471 RepID=A0A7R9NVZ2_9NEOP|nr:unnamed protein product [Timema tahoe]
MWAPWMTVTKKSRANIPDTRRHWRNLVVAVTNITTVTTTVITTSTPDRDLNFYIPVIGSLVDYESSTLEQAATESELTSSFVPSLRTTSTYKRVSRGLQHHHQQNCEQLCMRSCCPATTTSITAATIRTSGPLAQPCHWRRNYTETNEENVTATAQV